MAEQSIKIGTYERKISGNIQIDDIHMYMIIDKEK